jgi:hypothetical protein
LLENGDHVKSGDAYAEIEVCRKIFKWKHWQECVN